MIELTPALRARPFVLTDALGDASLSFTSSIGGVQLSLVPFFQGPPGISGAAAQVSDAAGNRLETGPDGGLFVPDLDQFDPGDLALLFESS